ncbi:hypothetical protein BC936DRAFT_138890, partial [Jimgerdemannia flammicorona]
ETISDSIEQMKQDIRNIEKRKDLEESEEAGGSKKKAKKVSLIELERARYKLEKKVIVGGKKGKKKGDEEETMAKLKAFREKLWSAQADEPSSKPSTAKPTNGQDMVEDGKTEPATISSSSDEPCKLHGIPGCESCHDTFGRTVDESDEGWLGHKLVFERDLKGKDLMQRKETTDDYLVIDPRARNEQALKEEREIMARKKNVVGEAFRRESGSGRDKGDGDGWSNGLVWLRLLLRCRHGVALYITKLLMSFTIISSLSELICMFIIREELLRDANATHTNNAGIRSRGYEAEVTNAARIDRTGKHCSIQRSLLSSQQPSRTPLNDRASTAIHIPRLVLEEHDVTVIFHKPTLRVASPQGDGDGRLVLDVRLPQHPLDVLRRLLRMVMRHLREEVMRDVGVGDMVMEVVQQPAIRPVDRQSRAALEVPDRLAIVWQNRIGDDVVLRDGQRGIDNRADGKNEEHADYANDRDDHIPELMGLEDRGGGMEVRGPAAVVLASRVNEEVGLPAAREHDHKIEQGGDGRFVEHAVVHAVLGVLVFGGEANIAAGKRDEDLVLGHVASSLVMTGVGDAPRVVGNQEGGVEDPADGIVDELGGGEGLVAALMGNDPDTSGDDALRDPVEGPKDIAVGFGLPSRWPSSE